MTKEEKKVYNRAYYQANKAARTASMAAKAAAQEQALQDLPRTKAEVCNALESAYCAYAAKRQDGIRMIILAIAAAELLRIGGAAE